MGIVTAKEVAKGLNLNKFGFLGTALSSTLMSVTKINALNEIYDDRKHLSGPEFLESCLAFRDRL